MKKSAVQSRSIRVSPSPHTSVSPSPHTSAMEGYTKIPYSVWDDAELQRSDVHVYRVLVRACWEGNTVSIGMRRIADTARMSVRHARECMARLIAGGHVEVKAGARGMRAVYVLTSNRFPAITVKPKEQKVVSHPRVERALNICGRCGLKRKVNISGYCRGCRLDAELERRQNRAQAG